MNQAVRLPGNSCKPITNTAWVRAWLCKLSKGCTRITAASDKVYQLLRHGRWFTPGTPASSTTKVGRHDIAAILLKVALNTKNQSINQSTLHMFKEKNISPISSHRLLTILHSQNKCKIISFAPLQKLYSWVSFNLHLNRRELILKILCNNFSYTFLTQNRQILHPRK